MPKLTDITIAQRIDQARQALQLWLLSSGELTIDDACKRIGLTTDQYYRWLKEDPDAVAELQQYLRESRRMELSLLSGMQEAVTAALIMDALGSGTKAGERLAIKKYMDDRIETLENQTEIRTDDSAAEFLTGANLEHARSRMTVEVSKDKVTITVDKKSDVIDGQVVESPPRRLLESVDEADLDRSRPV